MIIGLRTIGPKIPTSGTGVFGIKEIEMKNAIYDEVHANLMPNVSPEKDSWGQGTVLLATFNGDLEAGNIRMRENAIEKLRIKRRNVKNSTFKTLKEFAFSPDPVELVYEDYTASGETDYEYIVTPVDMAGIEGIITASLVKPRFDGWWLIDMENPEEYCLNFLYNIDDVSISIDSDRSKISTFGKYPIIRYGPQCAREGSLTSLFIPEESSVVEQIAKLQHMAEQHKPYMLKDGHGRKYIVDISLPSETIITGSGGVSKVSVLWTEVGECND